LSGFDVQLLELSPKREDEEKKEEEEKKNEKILHRLSANSGTLQ